MKIATHIVAHGVTKLEKGRAFVPLPARDQLPTLNLVTVRWRDRAGLKGRAEFGVTCNVIQDGAEGFSVRHVAWRDAYERPALLAGEECVDDLPVASWGDSDEWISWVVEAAPELPPVATTHPSMRRHGEEPTIGSDSLLSLLAEAVGILEHFADGCCFVSSRAFKGGTCGEENGTGRDCPRCGAKAFVAKIAKMRGKL